MLGLYTLIILIIGHKCCSRISMLNELTLQKEIVKTHSNHVLDKEKKHNNKTKKQINKPLQEPGIEPETSRTAVCSVTSRLPCNYFKHISVCVK